MTNEEAIEILKHKYASSNIDEALKIAVEALEKQIPKKCETREGRMVYRCPSCGKWFAGSVDYMIYFDLGPRFCSISSNDMEKGFVFDTA